MPDSVQPDEVDVVIIGAGPAGLALAIELGHRGVRCLLLEENDRVGLNPRAKTTNVRTREHLRRWGIADNLRAASQLPPNFPSDILFTTHLNGPLLAKIDNAFNCSPEKNDLYSESAQWIPQYVLEEVMRKHAVTLPSLEIRFGSKYLEASQNEDGVTVSFLNKATRQQESIRCRYLVGADGSRSVVRETVGATMQGVQALALNFSVVFRAPELVKLNPHPPGIMYYTINNDVPAILGPMDNEEHWYFGVPYIADPDNADPKDLIRRATGFDFEIEVLNTSGWAAPSLLADKYTDRRIFLIGDACHLHPPFGAYGMNMGVADGVDLGWKLAAVLQGWGGESLLDSYELERRPVHKFVINEAVENYKALGNHLTLPGTEDPGENGEATRRELGDVVFAAKLREFKTLGVVLGYRYEDSPVIIPDGTPAPEPHTIIYRPNAFPGCLAPHIWLSDGTSLYDHFGPGFTLLATTEEGAAELTRAAALAAVRKLPLKTLQPGDGRLHRRYVTKFALIRPDQHVAWRGDVLPEDLSQLFDTVTATQA